MLGKAVGGQRTTALNYTADAKLEKTQRDETKRISDMMRNTQFNLSVDRDDNFLICPKKTKDKTKKQMDSEDTTKMISEVLTVFLLIAENNFTGQENGVTKHFRKILAQLLRRVTTKLKVPSSSGALDDTDELDNKDQRMSMINNYLPRKTTGPLIVVDEKRKPSCSGKEDHADLDNLLLVLGQ